MLIPLSSVIQEISGEGTLLGFVQVEYDDTPFLTSTGPSSTPEPAAVWLLAIGLTSPGVLISKRQTLKAILRYGAAC